MNAWLKPLFGESYAEIALSGLLLPIGQSDAPFDTYPEELRQQLAVRHARLFLDDDTLYVVDLNSATGTTLNGEPLKDDPLEVAAGDLLCFGESLRFEACLSSAQEAEAGTGIEAGIQLDTGEHTQIMEVPRKPTLLLLPAKTSQGPSPIAVSDFPFLVSKSGGHFAVYKQQFAAEMSFVSRRHANIYARGADLYIEDLGSTNGTLHNGKRLEGTAELISAGDTLQFGHELFKFKVELELAPVQSSSAYATRRTVPEGTILVSTAGSFLDIYCDTPEPEAELSEVKTEDASAANQAPIERVQAIAGAVRDKTVAAWKQIPLSKEIRLGLLCLAGLALMVALGVGLLADDRAQQVEALLKQQQYEPALLMAEEYLAENPGDKPVQRLARKALNGYVVPSWSQAVLAGEYQAADSLLSAAREKHALSQGDGGVLLLLQWVGDMQRYVATRESATTVKIAEGQHAMEGLLQRWNSNSDVNMRLLDVLAREVPAFDPVRVAALSQLRALKSDASVLLGAMSKLRDKVLRPLDADTGAAALLAMNTFERNYPRVTGTDAWRADVLAYLRLKEAHAAEKLTDYIGEKKGADFQTDYFSKRVASEYPGVDDLKTITGKYALADKQWREGGLAVSLALSGSLAQGKWGAEAASLLAYRQQLHKDFMRLPELYQSPEYQTALLEFYTRIDSERDKFMYDALQSDFSSQQEFAAQRAEELRASVEQDWEDYQAQGGISGALRLESEISELYREQAARLSGAYKVLQQATQIYALVGADVPASLSTVNGAVIAEAERQRAAIEDLGAVLGTATVQDKTALLPAPLEAP